MTDPAGPVPGSEPVVPLWVFRFVNPWMTPLLRSRFRGPLGRKLLVLTYPGRRSGRLISHPAAFYPWADRQVIVFSSSRWWLNLVETSSVSLLIDGRSWRAIPHVIRDRDAVVRTVGEFIERVGPWRARLYRMGLPWSRTPTDADIAAVRRAFVFVQFELIEQLS